MVACQRPWHLGRRYDIGHNSDSSSPKIALGDWWTTSEVARFLGIAESTVRAYAARHKMPEPDAYVGATKLWRQQTIIEWAANRPRKGRKP
jgi:Helix-turn-helix domain